MNNQKNIANYYDQTLNHYQKWWNLNKSMSLHYGIWEDDTHTFVQALANTNKLMAQIANIKSDSRVLDAGCGVGGSAFYLAQNFNCQVNGITLSEKQLKYAVQKAREFNLQHSVDFQIMDFTQTSFDDNSFDYIWACESVCHTERKSDFIIEAYRLLKPGGRLIMADFFLPSANPEDPNQWLKKWSESWGVPHFSSISHFQSKLQESGFVKLEALDYTGKIEKSARRMYYASLAGSLPSEIYNLFHPKVSYYAKNHYKCGYYQYKALKNKLWNYLVLEAEKPYN